MTDRPGCRTRPDPVLAVEAFLGMHPATYRPNELAEALSLSSGFDPSIVAEVVAYLLAVGRATLDDEGYLVRHR